MSAGGRRDGTLAATVYGMNKVKVVGRQRMYKQKEVSETMKKSLRKLYRGLKGRKGQSLVEYALILALIAVVAILVLQGIGKGVNTKLASVNSNIN